MQTYTISLFSYLERVLSVFNVVGAHSNYSISLMPLRMLKVRLYDLFQNKSGKEKDFRLIWNLGFFGLIWISNIENLGPCYGS